MQPATKNSVVLTVIWFMGCLSVGGMLGTIYLCKLNTDPVLVAAAVKMIQTDPSSALAATNLLRADASIIAIIAGMTGVCIGGLNGMLNNTRTSHPDAEAAQVRETTQTTTDVTTQPNPVDNTPPRA